MTSDDAIVKWLRKTAAFHNLTGDQLRIVLMASERRYFRDGETVTSPRVAPPGAYLLLAGELQEQDSNAEPLPAGTMIGARCLFAAGLWPRRLVAVGEVEVLLIRRVELLKITHRFPNIAAGIAQATIKSLAGPTEGLVREVRETLTAQQRRLKQLARRDMDTQNEGADR